MNHEKLFTLPMLALALLLLCATANAQDSDKDDLGPYKFLTTISIPDGLVGFDISWVDSENGRYYLANRGDATATPPVAPTISVIDTRHNKFLYAIPLKGPNGQPVAGNGVVAIHRAGDDDDEDASGTLVVGTNDSSAYFIDLARPFAEPFRVSTGGKGRADELANDPQDHIILIANDRDADLFVTFISTVNPPHVVGQIKYDGSVLGNPKSTGGIEQPVWDTFKRRFYLAIPSTELHPHGEVDEIDPKTQKITKIFPTTCGPAGLVLIPGQRLMTSCGDVITIATGAITHVAGVGGDEIWFNPGDERVYFGGGTNRISVPVVSALPDFDVITTLIVGKINTPPTPNHTTHSVAADSETNRIFVPVSREGVKVYTDKTDDEEGPDD